MRNNVAKLYVIYFLTGLVFWYATEKVFMQVIGIGPVGVGINAVVLLSMIVLFDVPAGILADYWNRKYTLLLAVVSLGLSDLVLGASASLPIYLIGTVVYGAYLVLSSGTFQALMYDSLIETGRSRLYTKYQGRAYGLFTVGMAVSSLAGGYIAEYVGLRETYLFSLIPAALAVFVVLSLKEPQVRKEIADSKLFVHIKTSIKAIVGQPLVFHLALLLVVAGMLRGTQNEFAGLYYIGLALSTILMGYVNAGKWIASAIGQFSAPFLSRQQAFQLVPWFFIAFSGFALIINMSGLVFFFSATVLFSIVSNHADATIHDAVPSNIRATTSSMINFSTNLVMIPLSFAFGWLTSLFDVFHGYQVFAAIGLLYVLFWLLRSRKQVTLA